MTDNVVYPAEFHPDAPCDTEPSDPLSQAMQLDETSWRKFLRAMGWEDLEVRDE